MSMRCPVPRYGWRDCDADAITIYERRPDPARPKVHATRNLDTMDKDWLRNYKRQVAAMDSVNREIQQRNSMARSGQDTSRVREQICVIKRDGKKRCGKMQ